MVAQRPVQAPFQALNFLCLSEWYSGVQPRAALLGVDVGDSLSEAVLQSNPTPVCTGCSFTVHDNLCVSQLPVRKVTPDYQGTFILYIVMASFMCCLLFS